MTTKLNWPKVCSCGKSYGPTEWSQLKYVGVQGEVEEIPALELRNCKKCNSTMAQPLDMEIIECNQ